MQHIRSWLKPLQPPLEPFLNYPQPLVLYPQEVLRHIQGLNIVVIVHNPLNNPHLIQRVGPLRLDYHILQGLTLHIQYQPGLEVLYDVVVKDLNQDPSLVQSPLFLLQGEFEPWLLPAVRDIDRHVHRRVHYHRRQVYDIVVQAGLEFEELPLIILVMGLGLQNSLQTSDIVIFQCVLKHVVELLSNSNLLQLILQHFLPLLPEQVDLPRHLLEPQVRDSIGYFQPC